jgi:hypothetical protein
MQEAHPLHLVAGGALAHAPLSSYPWLAHKLPPFFIREKITSYTKAAVCAISPLVHALLFFPTEN